MAKGLRIYYASDIHGSERCFRKFLGAAKFYDASVLIMGGDITGKAMVPIVGIGQGLYRAQFHGEVRTLTLDELEEFERNVRFDGFYPYRCDGREYQRLAEDVSYRGRLFSGLMVAQIRDWVRLAEERLAPSGIRCYMMPGNDDEFAIDEAFASAYVVNPEGLCLEFDGVQMLSSCWTNPTPWDSPREESEDQLRVRLEKLAQELDLDGPTIFNLHCPPHGTTLDLAPKLTEDLQVVMHGTQVHLISVGSTAVRALIEEFQPLASLHGHIHESRAIERIGRTTCINPGSRYSEGVLDGVILEIGGGKVTRCQLVAG